MIFKFHNFKKTLLKATLYLTWIYIRWIMTHSMKLWEKYVIIFQWYYCYWLIWLYTTSGDKQFTDCQCNFLTTLSPWNIFRYRESCIKMQKFKSFTIWPKSFLAEHILEHIWKTSRYNFLTYSQKSNKFANNLWGSNSLIQVVFNQN